MWVMKSVGTDVGGERFAITSTVTNMAQTFGNRLSQFKGSREVGSKSVVDA